MGGGTGPAHGTCATTCTPAPSQMKLMLQSTDEFPINVGFTGKVYMLSTLIKGSIKRLKLFSLTPIFFSCEINRWFLGWNTANKIKIKIQSLPFQSFIVSISNMLFLWYVEKTLETVIQVSCNQEGKKTNIWRWIG